MSGKKILIVGASGLVGTAAVKLFAGLPDWDVVAVSRRAPFVPLGKARHIPVDLLNAGQCREVFGAMGDVTHVAYAAVNEQEGNMVAGWQDPVQAGKNLAMLRQPVRPADRGGERLPAYLAGARAEGLWLAYLGPGDADPVQGDLPRVPHENFYYHQEDYIAAKQAGQDWSWTVLRPAMIAGDAVGSNMNSYLVLGDLRGVAQGGRPASAPADRGQHGDRCRRCRSDRPGSGMGGRGPTRATRQFNIMNGDIFSLHDAFPIVADEPENGTGDRGAEFEIIPN
jgi:hypothetical protein